MATTAQVRALLEAGHGFDSAARRLSITPGLAYMLATGLPADGSGAPRPAGARRTVQPGAGRTAPRQPARGQPDRATRTCSTGSAGGPRATCPVAMAELPRPSAWPVLRQLRGADRLGRGAAVKSRALAGAASRARRDADRVVKSVCPYCAVGCAQNVFVNDERGGPDRGRPRRAAQPRPALPEGLGDAAADDRLLARAARPLPAAARDASGSAWISRRRWTWSPTASSRLAPRGVGVGARRRAHAPLHEHRRARRRDARQRGELPDQEAADRARDHPDREPGARLPQLDGRRARAPRSAAAPRARCPAICRTPT